MGKYRLFFRENYNGDNLDTILGELKSKGVSQMQSALILTLELKLSLSDADKALLNSKVWDETKEVTEKFRNDFGNFIDNYDE
ncbi:hypothetical protein [Emticicia sp. 17c]|uniref:hypothetical protein n=1 Tax=Emticicia sp. 17c TaxID=3127704 RepID=UPI00301DD883